MWSEKVSAARLQSLIVAIRLSALTRQMRAKTAAPTNPIIRARRYCLSCELDGKWTVVDPAPTPPGPQARGWIEPFSGARVARHAADGRVRDELTMA